VACFPRLNGRVLTSSCGYSSLAAPDWTTQTERDLLGVHVRGVPRHRIPQCLEQFRRGTWRKAQCQSPEVQLQHAARTDIDGRDGTLG
jgi:hypothetical protein